MAKRQYHIFIRFAATQCVIDCSYALAQELQGGSQEFHCGEGTLLMDIV